MNKGPNDQQIALDKARKQEEGKMKIMQERMEFIQKGIKELQEKAQVRIIPVLKTGPQAIQANIELVPESEKSLEECLNEYYAKQEAKQEAREEAEKAPIPQYEEPDQEKNPGLR